MPPHTAHCFPSLPPPLSFPTAQVFPHHPPQVLLERELAKLSAELDKDLRAIETRQPSPQVPASRPLVGDAGPQSLQRPGLGGKQEVSLWRTPRDLGQTSCLFALSSIKDGAWTFPSDP